MSMGMHMSLNMSMGVGDHMKQQMKLSPRVKEPDGGSDFTKFLLFTGRTVQNRKGTEHDGDQGSQSGSAP